MRRGHSLKLEVAIWLVVVSFNNNKIINTMMFNRKPVFLVAFISEFPRKRRKEKFLLNPTMNNALNNMIPIF